MEAEAQNHHIVADTANGKQSVNGNNNKENGLYS